MIRSLPKIGAAVIVLMVAALSVTIVFQKRSNARLGEELDELRSEDPHPVSEVEVSRTEPPELLRSRGEVGLLRARIAELGSATQLHEGVSELPNDTELLRLRREVGALRRQVATLGTTDAGSSVSPSLTIDVVSPYNSISNLFTAIRLSDTRAVRQFLSPGSDLLRRPDLDEVLAATLEKIQSVTVYDSTNVALGVSDPLPDRNGQTALLFELRNVEGKWLLYKVRESDLSYIEERLQRLSQQGR